MPAEFDVVDVRSGALLEQGQEFMLGAVEAAHSGVGLAPDDQVEGEQAEADGGAVNDGVAAPVDEGGEEATVREVREAGLHPGGVEAGELVGAHFPGPHDELAVGAVGDMAGDGDVVGLVGEDQPGAFALHEGAEDGRVCRIATDDAMLAEQEDVADMETAAAPSEGASGPVSQQSTNGQCRAPLQPSTRNSRTSMFSVAWNPPWHARSRNS